MVQPYLYTACRCAIDEYPLLVFGVTGQRTGGGGACVGEFAVGSCEGCGAEVGWLYRVAYQVGFADPGALGVWEYDRDGVAGGLEVRDEGVDIW